MKSELLERNASQGLLLNCFDQKSAIYHSNDPSASQIPNEQNSKMFTVAVRIRPELNTEEKNKSLIMKSHSSGQCQTLEISYQNICDQQFSYGSDSNRMYRFDRVFSEQCSNQEIYASLLEKKLDLLRNGINLSIMAYGATNSGKTHSIFGNSQRNVEGLAQQVFKRIVDNFSEEFSLGFSFVQIYNENVYDLLQEGNSQRKTLAVMEDGEGLNQIIGLKKIAIQGSSTVVECIQRGLKTRTACDNFENAQSSRSHALMELELTHKLSQRKVKMIIVDLAGSEKYSARKASINLKENSKNNLLKQGSNINRSLLTLGNCIKSLYSDERHIPYRDSKLTRLLKEHLKGYSHNILITCIAKEVSKWEENQNSLNYSLKAMKVEKELVRDLQDQQLSVYQCQHCRKGIPFSTVKEIIGDQELKVKQINRKNNRSLSSPSASSPVARMFSKKKQTPTNKFDSKEFERFLSKSFSIFANQVLSYIQDNMQQQEQVSNLVQAQKQQILKWFSEKAPQTQTTSFNRQTQRTFLRDFDKTIISEFDETIKEDNDGQNKDSFSNTQIGEHAVPKRRISLSITKKGTAQGSKKQRQLQREPSSFSQILHSEQQKFARDFSNVTQKTKQKKLAVEVHTNCDTIEAQRKQLLESMQNTQRPKRGKTPSIKFDCKSLLRGRNVSSFSCRDQGSISEVSMIQGSEKIESKGNEQFYFPETNNDWISIQDPNLEEQQLSEFDNIDVDYPQEERRVMLDSTCIAPRMKRDEDDLAGKWKDILIREVNSPQGFNQRINPHV